MVSASKKKSSGQYTVHLLTQDHTGSHRRGKQLDVDGNHRQPRPWTFPHRISLMTWTPMLNATGASRSTPSLENGMMRLSRHRARSQMSPFRASARGRTPWTPLTRIQTMRKPLVGLSLGKADPSRYSGPAQGGQGGKGEPLLGRARPPVPDILRFG